MKTGHKGIALIKQFEGLRLEAYLDPIGIPTIGYGHTQGVEMGDRITEAEAENYLRSDLEIGENELNRLEVALNQNQFDALSSFIFNLGIGNFRRSTLLKKVLNNPCDTSIGHEFMRWVYAGGVVLKGLERRRRAEYELYKDTKL